MGRIVTNQKTPWCLGHHLTSTCSRTFPLATRVKRPLMRGVLSETMTKRRANTNMQKFIVTVALLLLLNTSSLYGSPFTRDVFALHAGGHTWGVWEKVDIPTSDPFSPYYTAMYLSFGPLGTITIKEYSGSRPFIIPSALAVIFIVLYALIFTFGIKRKWSRVKMRRLLIAGALVILVSVLCFLCYQLGARNPKLYQDETDALILSRTNRHMSDAVMVLQQLGSNNHDQIASRATSGISSSLRRIAKVLGRADSSSRSCRELWLTLLWLEDGLVNNRYPVEEQRSESMLDMIKKLKDHIHNNFPERTVHWTLGVCSKYPNAILYHVNEGFNLEDFVKKPWKAGTHYPLAKETIRADQVKQLHEMLNDKKYESFWPNIAVLIGMVSTDTNSVPMLINYFKYADPQQLSAEVVIEKACCLEYTGLIGGDLAKRTLLTATTTDGAEELALNWIDDQRCRHEGGFQEKEDIIFLIRMAAIRGLVFLRDSEANTLLDNIYQDEMKKNKDAAIPDRYCLLLASAMGVKDYIRDHGLEDFLIGWHWPTQSQYFSYDSPLKSYIEKYTP